MKIKTKLSFQFTIIVIALLLLFSALVYYFSYTSQRSRFIEGLTKRAQNTGILLINIPEVDSILLKKIHRSTLSYEEEEIAVTDSAFHLMYNNNIQFLTDSVIRNHANKGDFSRFRIAEKDGICYKHRFNDKGYNVFVMAYDKSRRQNMTDLKEILFWINLFSFCLAILLSYLFSRKAIEPISRIIESVKAINSSRLSNRLEEGNKKDEIAKLAITFNEMLAELEFAFKNQEEFVSNASHEFRTPLSVMIVESDYILSRIQNPEEYRNHIDKQVTDLKILNAQLNSLLELAQINQEHSIQLSAVRIDEIVFNAIQQIKTKYSGRKIIPVIRYPENEKELLISGNAGMLVIAFKNLIDNACKFSEDDVIIEFIINDNLIKVIISDKGIGIPSGEIDGIYKPFSRASNVRFKSGFGIGLALVAKIFEHHNVDFKVFSAENEGTRFELIFKSMA
jgi:signal transduction histidine kinase